jgi:glycosyltransferase involved in cell wall biosynthesis
MHFIIGANLVDSRTTGLGRQMHGLGEALSNRGHRVDYLFADPEKSGARSSRLTFPVEAVAKVRRLVGKDGAPAIALLHEPTAWATALLRPRRVRTVAMVHNCEIKCWTTKLATYRESGESVALRSRLLWPLTELTQSYASIRSADAVFCLSTEDLNYMHRTLRVPLERIWRIDNGLEPSFLGLPFPETLPERDVLFVGHWLPHKGIRILTAALDKLAATGARPRVTLAGTGLTPDTIASSLPSSLRSTVEILPYVAPEDLVRLYQRHWIFVLPSVIEGIPLSMLEAMATGLCPVVSNVGGVPDVIVNGINGILVPRLNIDELARVLARCLSAPDETRQIARRAQADMQGYGWSRAAAEVEQACRKL